MKKPKNLKCDNFILKNFLGNVSEDVYQELIKVARQNNCEIIDISDKNSKFYDIGPSEFLYLEKNAFLVATDSFHACVFAILFSTPFIAFKRQGTTKSAYSRIETLVHKFEIQNMVFNGNITKKNFYNDYSKIQKILQKERKKTDEFLRKALE